MPPDSVVFCFGSYTDTIALPNMTDLASRIGIAPTLSGSLQKTDFLVDARGIFLAGPPYLTVILAL
jgi:hypothetical protein